MILNFAQIIAQYLFYLFLAKFMKNVCILDYILFLKNIIYYLINNLDFVLGIQKIMLS